jgi:hypothetical protein
MQAKFIRIQSKAIRLDAISYVDFLDSGRAMVILSGLPPEKAHISVDAGEARLLREYFDSGEVTVNPGRESRSTVDLPGALPGRDSWPQLDTNGRR